MYPIRAVDEWTVVLRRLAWAQTTENSFCYIRDDPAVGMVADHQRRVQLGGDRRRQNGAAQTKQQRARLYELGTCRACVCVLVMYFHVVTNAILTQRYSSLNTGRRSGAVRGDEKEQHPDDSCAIQYDIWRSETWVAS
jgi:hypothetical protein